MNSTNLMEVLYDSIGVNPHDIRDNPDIAFIEIHHNQILGVHLLPGFQVDAEETENGIKAVITVKRGTVLERPVQVCFGMVPPTGLQQIDLDINVEEDASAAIMAHCTFPFAREIRHEMEARINVAPNSRYAYFERHVHGSEGGVCVIPKSIVTVGEGAVYQTDFEIIKGRVGRIKIDLDVTAEADSSCEIRARASGSGDDFIHITEVGHLSGRNSRGVLATSIALRDRARAEIYNTLIASAPYARGHVDCKEIVQDQAVAKAVPIVEVTDPRAHVTHEAAIGSVDNKQLETLMSRGLTEDQAVDLIIEGLLRP